MKVKMSSNRGSTADDMVVIASPGQTAVRTTSRSRKIGILNGPSKQDPLDYAAVHIIRAWLFAIGYNLKL